MMRKKNTFFGVVRVLWYLMPLSTIFQFYLG